MKWPIVITLHGESGSGKDSTYHALQNLNPNLPRVSFGDMMRQDIYEIYNIKPMADDKERQPRSYYSPITQQLEEMTFKDLMIQYCRVMALENPFRYPEKVVAEIQKASHDYNSSVVVVTDARRPHELEAIRGNYRTYSFRVFYEGSTCKALDRILEGDNGIINLTKGSNPGGNADQIIDYMIRFLPRHPKTQP
jgi:hypothetical protein